jgi:hypothetical protein
VSGEGAADGAAGAQASGRQGRGGEPVPVVAGDVAEGVPGRPLLAGGDDLVVVPGHEVPPHDDPLLERRSAEQHRPGAGGRPHPQIAAGRAEVEHRARAQRHTVDLDRAVHHEHRVLEPRLERQQELTARPHGEVGADQRGEHPPRRLRAGEGPEEDGHRAAGVGQHGELGVLLPGRGGGAVGVGQRHPQLHAVQQGRVRHR